MSQLDQLLPLLMSMNNDSRMQAESMYNYMLENQLLHVIERLLQIASDRTIDTIIRSFSAVLLRRTIEKYSKGIDGETTKLIRSGLLNIWAAETEVTVIRHFSHAMAQSAAQSSWLDLLPTIITHGQSGQLSNSQIVPILSLIEIIADYCPDDILTHLQKLGTFLGNFMGSSDINVRTSCAKATAACIVALEDEGARNSFKPALLPIVSAIGDTLNNGNEHEATGILDHLVTIAQIQPLFYRGALDNIATAMMAVAGNTDYDFSTRAMALELLVTLSETAPALARRSSTLIRGICPVVFSIMLEIEEDESEWVIGKYSEEDMDEDCSAGEDAIERMAAGMGGRTLAEPVLGLVSQYFSQSNWKYRRAAVAGLTRLAEGATQVFQPHLETTLQFLCAAISDASHRVRYEAIQSIGRLAVLYPNRVPSLVDRFVPTLTAMLCDANTCDRVRGHTASAMINLMNPENCSKDVLQQGGYLEPLLQALVLCLQSASREVQPACLSLLGCLAQTAEDSFFPYYPSLIPGLKSILFSATSEDLVILRGKAMECIGLIGEAVGAEIFSPDANEVMGYLVHAMTTGSDTSSACDTVFEYILPTCARISKALGPQFEVYLPVIMGPLLAGATQDIKFSMEDANDDDVEGEIEHDEDNHTESTVVCFNGLKKKVTMNTHAVQQKDQAAKLLYEFGSSMKGHLKGYLAPAVQTLIPMITDKHSGDIRASSCLAVAKIFDAYVDAVKLGFVAPTELQHVLTAVTGKLLENVRGETNETTRGCAAEALHEIYRSCYYSGAENPDGTRTSFLVIPEIGQCQAITQELMQRCAESLERRQEKEAMFRKNEGMEEEDKAALEEELEEEEDVLRNYVDAIGHFLKLHGEAFMPYFDSLIAPAFGPYLSPSQPESLQVVAICMIDDAIEFGGAFAHKYIAQSLPILLHNCVNTANPLLKQCSIYGIAQVARAAPQAFAQHFPQLVQMLLSVISDPAADEEENEGITENAIFAIGTVCSHPYYRQAVSWETVAVDINQLVSVWLQRLPLKTDELVCKLANQQLCDMLEGGDPVVYGNGYSNLPQLLRVLAENLFSRSRGLSDTDGEIVLHPSSVQRMQNIIRQISISISQSTLQAAFSTLDQQHFQVLQEGLATST